MSGVSCQFCETCYSSEIDLEKHFQKSALCSELRKINNAFEDASQENVELKEERSDLVAIIKHLHWRLKLYKSNMKDDYYDEMFNDHEDLPVNIYGFTDVDILIAHLKKEMKESRARILRDCQEYARKNGLPIPMIDEM